MRKIRFLASSVWAHITQFFYNRKRLETVSRIALLEFLVDKYYNSIHNNFRLTQIEAEIYSIRFFIHPENEIVESRLQLYLGSLVESEELSRNNFEYSVNPKAITTLSEYQDSERRHLDNIKVQRGMVFVTFLVFIVMIIQAIILFESQ